MLTFQVQDDDGQTYKIEAEREGDNLTITCSCEAAADGQFCLHRYALLCGEAGDLASDNENGVEALVTLAKGTDVGICTSELQTLENEIRELTTRTKTVKKALARAMDD